MSTTHTLHADEDPRDCTLCGDSGRRPSPIGGTVACSACSGTGRLGNENAEKVIEVFQIGSRFHARMAADPTTPLCDNFADARSCRGAATAKQALDAARLALGGRIG